MDSWAEMFFRSPLFFCRRFFGKKMIAVGAVENCALCSFPTPLWTRSLRPQGGQRQQRLRVVENFRTRRQANGRVDPRKRGDTEVATPLEKIVPGASSAVFGSRPPLRVS